MLLSGRSAADAVRLAARLAWRRLWELRGSGGRGQWWGGGSGLSVRAAALTFAACAFGLCKHHGAGPIRRDRAPRAGGGRRERAAGGDGPGQVDGGPVGCPPASQSSLPHSHLSLPLPTLSLPILPFSITSPLSLHPLCLPGAWTPPALRSAAPPFGPPLFLARMVSLAILHPPLLARARCGPRRRKLGGSGARAPIGARAAGRRSGRSTRRRST